MPSYSGVWTLSQQFQGRGQGLWPAPPGAPTIGTATAGINACASVAFTAPACTGTPAGITGYTATSTPGCITASGASSPVVVTGLTTGTSYTFKVRATGSSGLTSACSAASNSITAVVVTCATFTTAGTFSWVAPAGVTSVAAVVVGGGAGGKTDRGGGGGGLAWRNSISVTPGSSYTVVVGVGGANAATGCAGNGGQSSFGGATANGGNRLGAGGTFSGGGGGGTGQRA